MDELMARVFRVFLPEASEMVERLHGLLHTLRDGPEARRVFGEIEKTAHALKGASQTVCLHATAEVLARMESVARVLKDTERDYDQEVVDRMRRGVELIRETLDRVAGGASEPDELSEVRSILESWSDGV